MKKVNVEALDDDKSDVGDDANEFSPTNSIRNESGLNPPKPSQIESKLLFRTHISSLQTEERSMALKNHPSLYFDDHSAQLP